VSREQLRLDQTVRTPTTWCGSQGKIVQGRGQFNTKKKVTGDQTKGVNTQE